MSGALGTRYLADGQPTPRAPQPPSTWSAGNRITVKVSSGVEGQSATYGFLIAENGDVKIEIDEESGAKQSVGTLLLVGGRMMASRGVKLDPGREIDTVDVAGLSWQVAARLLERGAPGNPAALTKSIPIDVLEEKIPISVNTTTAEGSYPVPWTANGSVKPLHGGKVSFDVTFSFRPSPQDPKPVHVRYSGTWERVEPPPGIDDGMSLNGWTIYSLGPIHRKDARGETFDYGASPISERYVTLGGLRTAMGKAATK